MDDNQGAVAHQTADIVSAFVAHNNIDPAQLGALIHSVHTALVIAPAAAAQPEAPALVPAVSIKKSITPDYIISLEDGRKFKSMKRYLGKLGMTPEDYRVKWSLPGDYPMVAPNYADARSNLAKRMGPGRKANSAPSTEKAARSRKRAA